MPANNLQSACKLLVRVSKSDGSRNSSAEILSAQPLIDAVTAPQTYPCPYVRIIIMYDSNLRH